MNFSMNEAIQILERTPQTLESLLTGLSGRWLQCNEGEGTWNPVEIINHLIDAERTNWIPRLEFTLREGKDGTFPSFDRYAFLKESTEVPLEPRLQVFKEVRADSVATLLRLVPVEAELEKTGKHPTLGEVKVRELLSTWVVHDLTHMTQILRVMALRYSDDVGPFKELLGVLRT